MIPKRALKKIEIQRCQNYDVLTQIDSVVIEEPLEIRLLYFDDNRYQNETLTLTMRTPGNDFELATGFLLAEGIIQQVSDIVKMSYCVKGLESSQEYNVLQVKLTPAVKVNWTEIKRNFMSSSSCGVCGKTSLESLVINRPRLDTTFSLDIKTLYSIPQKFSLLQKIFNQTGGLHGAALCSADGEILAIQEDIGRHNAVDKVIGTQLMAKQEKTLSNALLMVSGRTSYEIMQKALVAGIPFVVGIGPPSSLAIELAKTLNMTLVGFIKESSINIYAGSYRIEFPK